MKRALFALLCVLFWSAPAAAKTVHRSPYTYSQTYGTALRLLKVDLDLEITETNADWGYLLFSYTSVESGDRHSRGSAQFVEVDGAVQVSVQIAQMPSYHEQIIIEKLKRKLYDEHGEPTRPTSPPDSDDRDRDGKDKDGRDGRDKAGGDDRKGDSGNGGERREKASPKTQPFTRGRS